MIAIAASVLALVAPQQQAPAVEHKRERCRTDACERRMTRRRWRRIVRPHRAWIDATARCESGMRWTIYNPPYSGGMQFVLGSWRAVGGVGYPHQASILEQMYRAVLLLRLQGRGAWPVCG